MSANDCCEAVAAELAAISAQRSYVNQQIIQELKKSPPSETVMDALQQQVSILNAQYATASSINQNGNCD